MILITVKFATNRVHESGAGEFKSLIGEAIGRFIFISTRLYIS